MNSSNIDWTDYSWNPVTGCNHGCSYCYARNLAETRLSHIYKDGFKPTFWEDRLEDPGSIQRSRRVFVSSMGDLFGDWVPDIWISKIIEAVKEYSQHTFYFLTKNPERYLQFDFPSNAFLGITVDCSDDTSIDYNKIVNITAEIKKSSDSKTFLSFEPLLGSPDYLKPCGLDYIDWIIIGAQTGRNEKQPEMEWVLTILVEAHNRKIPIFIKDNLDWNLIKPQQHLEMVK